MKNMNNAEEPRGCWDDHFMGSVTVGDRGQIVIPAEARESFDIQPGDKLLIMRHPSNWGILVTKIDGMRKFLDEFDENLTRIENDHKEAE